MLLIVEHVFLVGRVLVLVLVDGVKVEEGEVEVGAPVGEATLVQHDIQSSDEHIFQLSRFLEIV